MWTTQHLQQCKNSIVIETFGIWMFYECMERLFQMHESTGQLTVEMFCSCIAHNPVLHACYLCTCMEEDTKCVSLLHDYVHGIPGMLGSLDCMHVHWKNCPIAYQGPYQGKEKFSTLVLEAITDHYLWFWHAAFGFTGVAMTSIFLMSVHSLDGSHSKIDFEFTIDEQVFNKLFYMVEGIYPLLSHFVKTIPIPMMKKEKSFAGWPEAAQKDVKCAFGVLQS